MTAAGMALLATTLGGGLYLWAWGPWRRWLVDVRIPSREWPRAAELRDSEPTMAWNLQPDAAGPEVEITLERRGSTGPRAEAKALAKLGALGFTVLAIRWRPTD